ncbi:hypothetical protein SDC9_142826 [bioreactor metagenome]|uniref:Uncharacterized protein n=1 Tax=bioreactor metagenome TaxID=1076179 RepID=A0A645E287_9ZZZZ
MLFRFAQLANHLNAGKPAAANCKCQQALSFKRVFFIGSAFKHLLYMRAQLDRVLIRPERMRIFLGTLDAKEVWLAADCDDQVIKLIRSLCACNTFVCDVALCNLVCDDLYFSSAENFP